MEAKHTPGPWFITGGEMTKYVEARIGNRLLQEVAAVGPTVADDGYGDQQQANARLIAAAPELLEALQSLLKRFPTEDDMHIAGWEQSEIDLACRDYEAARAAVVKATQ